MSVEILQLDRTTISDQPGYDSTYLRFRCFVLGAGLIRAWRLTLDGDRRTGRKLAGNGLVCGLDRCGPNSRSLVMPSGTVQDATITYEATQPKTDGTYPVELNHTDEERWVA